MKPQRTLLHQLPAWLLVIGMLVVGSGWTYGGWSGGYSYNYSSPAVNQYNFGDGNHRNNVAMVD